MHLDVQMQISLVEDSSPIPLTQNFILWLRIFNAKIKKSYFKKYELYCTFAIKGLKGKPTFLN